MDNCLAQRLRELIALGNVRTVAYATEQELDDFLAEPNACHSNVDRWCQLHPGHRRMRGWLITGTGLLDKHSVVDRGSEGLVDITPISGRSERKFLVDDTDPANFDLLQNQIILPDWI